MIALVAKMWLAAALFAGILIAGCFLCEASEYLAPRIKDMNVKVLLFVIGESLLVFLSAAAFIGHSTHIHAVLFFIIALICIFTNNLHCNIRLPYYLGKISLYIYIWNWTVGTFIRQYFNGLSVFQIKLLYFLMTITFAIISERTLVFITKILSNKSNPYYLELRTSNKDIA